LDSKIKKSGGIFMTVIEEFTDAFPLANPWINSWKSEGKKVLGYYCSYIPEEIIYAADILPVRVRARTCSSGDTPMGDAYLTPTACSFTRCCLELTNRNQFNFFDGIISCNCCDQIRRLYDNIRYKAPFPYHYIIGVPGCVTDTTLDWFKHEVNRLKENLEKEFKVSIPEQKISEVIKTYNKSRSLLKDIYELRKRDYPPLSGTDMLNILSAGISMPRDQFNELLHKQITQLKEKDEIKDHKARIMIIGSLLDEPEYVELIENLGGLVVTDSLCVGSRYFWDLADEKKKPIDALAERYLLKVSCPRMTDGQPQRAEFMMEMIKQFNVDGVIFQRMKFCPIWWSEVFMLRERLKKEEIPYLELEREYVLSGAGAMKTRVQTFMEILEGR
jgi:benzoyl-CoA reductase/2-hydroxyglutaryl-CoA dehydratase subunit BcrC/BadD/HgdB